MNQKINEVAALICATKMSHEQVVELLTITKNELLLAFISWHNENYEPYISNSEIGKFNIQSK